MGRDTWRTVRLRVEMVGARLVAGEAIADHVPLDAHPLRARGAVALGARQGGIALFLLSEGATMVIVGEAEIRGQGTCARRPGHGLLHLAVMALGAVGLRRPERLP